MLFSIATNQTVFQIIKRTLKLTCICFVSFFFFIIIIEATILYTKYTIYARHQLRPGTLSFNWLERQNRIKIEKNNYLCATTARKRVIVTYKEKNHWAIFKLKVFFFDINVFSFKDLKRKQNYINAITKSKHIIVCTLCSLYTKQRNKTHTITFFFLSMIHK